MTGIDIELKRLELVQEKWKSELDYLNSSDLEMINNDKREDRIHKIDALLDLLKAENDKKTVDYKKDLFQEINEKAYEKQWHKLPAFHKINKIKEYINEKYGEGEFQNKMIFELVKLVETNKMNTKNAVDYSIKNKKIESILILKVDLENKTYEIVSTTIKK